MTTPPLFKHQETSLRFMEQNKRVFDASDPGTGKTRVQIEAFAARRRNHGGKALVLAPKSILTPAWGRDFASFAPDMEVNIANADNRTAAFKRPADVYITNHDAASWLVNNRSLLTRFDTLIIDESTAYKNHTAIRSKNVAKLAQEFEHRTCMSGTPTSNGLTDIWHQIFVLDDGERLGTSYWKFRSSVCEPRQVGPRPEHINWVDKPGAEDAVASILSDITIRHKFEECIDIPENFTSTITFRLDRPQREAYETLRKESVLELQTGQVDAINAAAMTTKLLQVASGSVYGRTGHHAKITTARYELVMALIEAREQCLVAFNWDHQRKALEQLATDRKIPWASIAGDVNAGDRAKAVDDFQAGRIKVIFAHPASAGHGLTLTRGTTTIWASPTYNAEHFEQFNRRIYRAGQTRKTETLLIAAENTIEEAVYDRLAGKCDRMANLLNLLEIL